ncbi:MAG: 4'-phosphopantetheinyl transferase superfamily protein [Legionellaceae bacterium]|nr:4'-phosphopantetheinyl transferase superfamily protein [Legionellaceae bacterium]
MFLIIQHLCMIDLRLNHIIVWSFSLDREFTDQDIHLLDKEEQAHVERISRPLQKKYFIISHGTLRKILALYLKAEPAQITIASNAHGKPYCLDNPKLMFNLTHSENKALLAVGYQYPLGVDLEKLSQRSYLELAERWFSLEEYAYLQRLHEEELPLEFFKVWTQKEAYVKALGIGIAYGLQNFTVPLGSVEAEPIQDTTRTDPFLSQWSVPWLGYMAALCYHPSIQNIEHRVWYEPEIESR